MIPKSGTQLKRSRKQCFELKTDDCKVNNLTKRKTWCEKSKDRQTSINIEKSYGTELDPFRFPFLGVSCGYPGDILPRKHGCNSSNYSCWKITLSLNCKFPIVDYSIILSSSALYVSRHLPLVSFLFPCECFSLLLLTFSYSSHCKASWKRFQIK